MKNSMGLLFGTCFGGLLGAANLHEYDTIHAMLRLDEFDVYGLMATSVLVATSLLWWLERRQLSTVLDGELTLQRSRPERHHLIGGGLFGVGWAIAGTCPAPALVMVSSGATFGLIVILGIFIGIYLGGRKTTSSTYGDGEHHSSREEFVSI